MLRVSGVSSNGRRGTDSFARPLRFEFTILTKDINVARHAL
jgi:hypothetical protein